jgi:ADP-ribosylation factor GTPase-activating protein 1
MDRWSEEQITRMDKGGNGKARAFFEEKFGANCKQLSIPQKVFSFDKTNKYDSDVALDYRDKLSADVEGKTWTPQTRPARTPRSSTPQVPSAPISRVGSSSSLRPQSKQSNAQKERNEQYFAGLGSANAARPENLPPSQGGRYTGFGSTPTPQPARTEAISVEDFTSDPLGALTKGWGIFSRAAVKTASTINETYVQPSVAKVSTNDETNEATRSFVPGKRQEDGTDDC